MFLILLALHVSSPLRYFVIAAAGELMLDGILTLWQQWRLRTPGMKVQWADCIDDRHANCNARCEAIESDRVDVTYDLLTVNVPAMSTSPGSFVYLRNGLNGVNGPFLILWHEECDGYTIETPEYLRRYKNSDQEKIRTRDDGDQAQGSITGGKLFFLVKRKEVTSHLDSLNCNVRLEGPYPHQGLPSKSDPNDLILLFAADDGIISALSHVKRLRSSGVDLKLYWYTTDLALMLQIHQFYIAKVARFLSLEDTEWVFDDAGKPFPKVADRFFEIRNGFYCERDLARASQRARRTCQRIHVLGECSTNPFSRD